MADLSDRKQVALATKAAKLAEMRRGNVVREIMSTTPGREWMWERLVRCHIFATTFTANASQTAFNEGERSIGLLDIVDIMQFCPQQYILMTQESNTRNLANASRDSASERSGSQDGDGGDQAGEFDYPGAEGRANH